MSVSLSIIFNGYQSFLGNGLPNSGGYIYTYLAGTTTPATTYTNNGGAIANPNPIPLSASGNPLNPIWLTDGVAYKMVVVDKNLAQVPNATFDNVTGSAGGIFSFLLTLAASAGSSLVGFLQAGTGAVVQNVQSKLRGLNVDIADFGGVADGVTSCSTAAAAAITYLTSVGGGTLRFGRGTYVLNNNEKISITASNISIIGQGRGSTIIKRVGTGGTALIEAFSTTLKKNIEIADLTLECNSINSGVQVQYVNRFTVRNCNIQNPEYWGVYVGIGDGTLATRVNSEVLISGCNFSGGKKTFENVLLFNSERVTVTNCTFSDGKAGVGPMPALGLYQNLERIIISNCHFDNVFAGLYYSLSTNSIIIAECTFQDCTIGVWGANTPDNGIFGSNYVYNMTIANCTFMRCQTGLEFGAVLNCSITACTFKENENAMVVNYGNAPTNTQPSSCSISDCQFINNNRYYGTAILRPAIIFNGGGGAFAFTISGCNFVDTQTVKSQLIPITFSGAFNWTGINFFGGSLSGYSGQPSIALDGGATLTGIKLYGCMNVTSLPSGVTQV